MTSLGAAPPVVCPFCSLGCDDVMVTPDGRGGLAVESEVGPACRRGFELPLGDPTPRVDGRPVDVEAAIDAAAALLGRARQPVVTGLAADTDGLRAALRVAERLGAAIDHRHGAGLVANLRVMQTTGWVTTTLAEARSRADLFLFFGTDSAAMPRFVRRIVWHEALGPELGARRRVVALGEGLDAGHLAGPAGQAPAMLACPPAALVEVAAALRALAAGQRLGTTTVGGLPTAALADLVRQLREAAYPVVVWAAGELPPEAARSIVTSLAELTKDLNATGRAFGLPLAAAGNVVGAGQVAAWSWGTGLRSSVAAGAPAWDPDRFAAAELLGAGGAADACLWVDALASEPPALPALPTVALLRPGLTSQPPPAVLIPVGTPGLDHAGSVFRTDSVVALPLRALRSTGLPSVATVLAALDRRLAARPC